MSIDLLSQLVKMNQSGRICRRLILPGTDVSSLKSMIGHVDEALPMYPIHFLIHLLDLFDESLAVIGIINLHVILLSLLLLLKCFQIAVTTISVDMSRSSQVINHGVQLTRLATARGKRLPVFKSQYFIL
jgi:hypothetical protein